MQQLRFVFAMALLYMFRVTISPIIRSGYLQEFLLFGNLC